MIVQRFSKYLEAIEYPKEKTSWNIAGIIKGTNAFYRFDVRNMFKLSDGTFAQKSRMDTKANKMVIERKKDWVILDLEELLKHVKKNKLKKVYVDKIITELEWNTILYKDE
jgi:hypothetical protein